MLDLFSDTPDYRLLRSTIFATEKDVEYAHSFGAAVDYTGTTHPDCKRPWHLLYRLDLTDPTINIEIPGCRFLPLFNAFQYDSSTIQYRPTSDATVDLIYQERLTFTPEFPYDGFPDKLPALQARHLYDSPEEITFDEELQEFWWDYDEDKPLESEPTRDELCALAAGVNQLQILGHTPCKNCGQIMQFLASATGEPEEGVVSIWGGAEYVAILYMLCPDCHTVQSSNLAN